MDKIYFNPRDSGSFGGINRLQRRAKKTNKSLIKWSSYHDAYTLHKSVQRKFKRRKIIVGGFDDQWQIDLVDVSSISDYNDNNKFILTCIDVLSKFVWVAVLKNKTAYEVVNGMMSIFNKTRRRPNKIQGDKGKEFLNHSFQSLLKKRNITFFSTENDDIKASIVERFNRTLKERMWRYFTHVKSYRYIDRLSDFILSYNASHHRTLGTAPKDVTKVTELKLLRKMHFINNKRKNIKFKIDDKVRIVMTRRPYKKGYTGSWSHELFKISDIIDSNPITYSVKDLSDENIKGSFYAQELQKINVTSEKLYIIETVLKKRIRYKKEEYFVKWKGYPDKFNSWVLKDKVEIH